MSTSSEHPADRPTANEPQVQSPRSGGKKRRRRRRHPVLATLGWIVKILGTLLLVGIVTGCFVACYGVIYIQKTIMPEAAKLDLSAFVLNEPSTIYYTNKETGQYEVLATIVGKENRIILKPEEIPQVFKDVVIAAEDKRFLSHKGVDWIRTAAAVLYMFTGRDIQGGSTITQQVIKNYTQKDEVTVGRKILEIFEALATENKYSKDEILAMYLNKIFLGNRQCGIAAASRYYFNKDVNDITLAEAASIIAITNNPSLYGPYSTVETKNSAGVVKTGLERNKDRQETILWVMWHDIGMLSEEEYRAAIAEPLVFARDKEETEDDSKGSASFTDEIYSYYVDQVIVETVSYLMSQGYSREAAESMVYNGGLHIYTPFDPFVQEKVDVIYTDRSNLSNPKTGELYISKDGQLMQSCITVVDNDTGYVVAMAGQMGEKTGNRWWNFATDSTRQPGSSIKPLAVYSAAIEMGKVTPYSIIDDSPYMLLNGKPYPRNDSGGYVGLRTVINALTNSTNTVAVKLIANYVTPDGSVEFMRERYGITTLVDHYERNGRVYDDHGLPQMALGGLTKGLSPYEMTAAYATFPRGGTYTEPTVVLRVENRDHQTIWDHEPKTSYPIKSSTAYYMNVMLQNAATYGTGSASKFGSIRVAGKTGTTTDNYDRWFAGYTPYYTAVVWTGYERNAYMSTSGNPAITLWRKVMEGLHEGLEDKEYFTEKSLNLKSYTVCLDCGQLATDACRSDIRGNRSATYTFVDGTQPRGVCTCHVPITICNDCPVLKADGTPMTNVYHLAGEHCPAESVRTVYVVNLRRDPEVCGGVNIGDSQYMITYYEAMEEAGTAYCTVHTAPPEDPTVPDWPDDPNNPDDPGSTDPSVPGGDPGSLLPPSATQSPEVSQDPQPSQSGEAPPDEPFLPAA